MLYRFAQKVFSPSWQNSSTGPEDNNLVSVSNKKAKDKERKILKSSVNLAIFSKIFFCASKRRKKIVLKGMESTAPAISWADSGVSPSKRT